MSEETRRLDEAVYDTYSLFIMRQKAGQDALFEASATHDVVVLSICKRRVLFVANCNCLWWVGWLRRSFGISTWNSSHCVVSPQIRELASAVYLSVLGGKDSGLQPLKVDRVVPHPFVRSAMSGCGG